MLKLIIEVYLYNPKYVGGKDKCSSELPDIWIHNDKDNPSDTNYLYYKSVDELADKSESDMDIYPH